MRPLEYWSSLSCCYWVIICFAVKILPGVKYPAGHLPSRHSPNIRASAAAWLIARGNKIRVSHTRAVAIPLWCTPTNCPRSYVCYVRRNSNSLQFTAIPKCPRCDIRHAIWNCYIRQITAACKCLLSYLSHTIWNLSIFTSHDKNISIIFFWITALQLSLLSNTGFVSATFILSKLLQYWNIFL